MNNIYLDIVNPMFNACWREIKTDPLNWLQNKMTRVWSVVNRNERKNF